MLEAEKRLSEITFEAVKKTVKRLEPTKFDKMVLIKESLKRQDMLFWHINFFCAGRSLEELQIPLFEGIRSVFEKYESTGKQGKEYADASFHKLMNARGRKFNYHRRIEGALDFPIQITNGKVANPQPVVYFPEFVRSEVCKKCKGEKYITCPHCDGEHQWVCPECSGDGRTACAVCKATGETTCGTCNASGKKKCPKCHGQKNILKNGEREICPICKGTGSVICRKCNGRKKVTCSHCDGKKYFVCKKCRGKGIIVCDYCYADSKKRGLIDCPVCETAGAMGYIPVVTTRIYQKSQTFEQVIGDTWEFPEEILTRIMEKGKNFEEEPVKVYENLNGKIIEEEAQILKNTLPGFERKLGLSRNSFPLILSEQVNINVITNLRVTFKHLFTRTEHEIIITDFHGEPELIYLSEPQELPEQKDLAKNVTKMLGRGLTKLFKTKKYKERENKKSELLLMIYLAKADGKIEDEEKIFIMNKIDNMEFLSQKEKKHFYNLMNLIELPPLTVKDIKFSSPEKAYQVLENLHKLAAADGKVEVAETRLLKDFEKLIKEWEELKTKNK